MKSKEMKSLILSNIPSVLTQLNRLRQLCGSPKWESGGAGFARSVLELEESGQIDSGFTQNKGQPFPLEAYKSKRKYLIFEI